MTLTRQLAAIMFTDIVGYTALMGKDSEKALKLVRISKEIQKPLVEKHNGKWLKEMGDGAMAQFSTALDAVNCSIEIQEIARGKLDAKLRIGIHLGDVTVEEHDVYGDGVNVASRLESIADPGGIYVSDAIEKAIRGQTNIQAKYLGEARLKNVDYGVRIYALQGVGLPVPDLKQDKELTGRFLAELQRRGVLRAGILYILVSLLLILLLPYLQSWAEIPAWAGVALIITLVIGLPMALILAWRYEHSPDGFVRTSSENSWQNPLDAGQRKPLTSNFIIVGLILVIIAIYAYPRYVSPTKPSDQAESEVTIDDKSIAVLPFTNMSNDPDQEYFSDGMMEEILNHLVKIEDLQVTSRTSVMQYKGTTKTIGEIAKELGVATILEGSVRKAGNKVRITVQLINGKTDKHLWSETFDRTLDDIFAIQSEVAQLVASSLQAKVRPEVLVRIESQPTANMEAYNLWLEGNFLYTPGEAGNRAMDLWKKAIELDPNFAPAYVSIGNDWLNRGGFAGKGTREEFLPKASSNLKRAMELDPDYPALHESLGNMHLWYEWDFEAAGKEFERFFELSPASINRSFSDFLNASGRFEEAIEMSKKLVAADVNNSFAWSNKGLGYYLSGQIDMGNAHYDTALKLFPESQGRWFLDISTGRAFIYAGRYKRAIEVLTGLLNIHPDYRYPIVLGSLAIAHYHLGDLEQVNALLKEIENQSKESPAGSPSFYLAMIHAQMGEIDAAFQWLDKAYEDKEVEMYWLKVEPPFEPLHDDPRWQVMLDKVGFPD